MTVLCVDDEELVLGLTLSMCREIGHVTETVGFSFAGDALEWAEKNTADIAILDVDLPDINGMVLAKKLKEMQPGIRIIFLTGYAEFAVGAFKLRASGYLLKPVNKKRLEEELEYAMQGIVTDGLPLVTVRTFGNFDVICDGKSVSFSRSRSKELLAYLVDRQGSGVTRAEAFAALWEDADYDRSAQKQFDVIIRSLRDTLQKAGIEDVIETGGGTMRVCTERLDCDLYRFLAGDEEAINSFRGEYMSAYPWASMTEGYLEEKRLAFGNG